MNGHWSVEPEIKKKMQLNKREMKRKEVKKE
jgi:hypothetical protein